MPLSSHCLKFRMNGKIVGLIVPRIFYAVEGMLGRGLAVKSQVMTGVWRQLVRNP